MKRNTIVMVGVGLGILGVLWGGFVYIGARFDRIDHATEKLQETESPARPEKFVTPRLTPAVQIPEGPWKKSYVPIYSHTYSRGGYPVWMEATLVVGNTSEVEPAYFRRVDYFNSSGKLVRSEAKKPFMLRPLESVTFLVQRRDHSGGAGANFIVEWKAPTGAPPHIEAVFAGDQPVSFSPGRDLGAASENSPSPMKPAPDASVE